MMTETPLSCAPAHDIKEDGRPHAIGGVDAFLLEALENPRHRLTVLRMELDIQKFMQNCDQKQFEFQHLPTSYLRCAAHRVAQHYGLQTMALDNALDGFSSRVVAIKTPESRFPAVYLSDVPTKQPEKEKNEHVKIVIRPRPGNASLHGIESGTRKSPARTVEERKEEYDKARARIFSGHSSLEVENPSSVDAVDARKVCLNRYEQECFRTVPAIKDHEKIVNKDGGASTVAIFRDREKDQTDPDYDRSYDRYVRAFVPSHDFSLRACSVQPSFLQYEPVFHQLDQFPRTHQTSVSYMTSEMPVTPFSAVGCNNTSPEAAYMQWPTPAMMYAHSYDHFRHAIYQAPVYQQPLSTEHWQNR